MMFRPILPLFVLFVSFFGAVGSVTAQAPQTFYWGFSGPGSIPISGTWDTTTPNWFSGGVQTTWVDSSTATPTTAEFNNGFEGFASAITVVGTRTASGMTFSPGGSQDTGGSQAAFTFAGGTIALADGTAARSTATAFIGGSGTAAAANAQFNAALSGNNITFGVTNLYTSATVPVTYGLGNAANGFTGTLTVDAKTVLVANGTAGDGKFGTGTVRVNGGGTLDVGTSGTFANAFRFAGSGATGQAGALVVRPGQATVTVAGPVTLDANAQFALVGGAATDTLTFGGAIGDSGSARTLALTGTGTYLFTGTNTYTGATTVAAGTTLRLGSGGTTGSVAGDLVTNGTTVFNRSDAVAYAKAVTGTGTVTFQGGGAYTLTGAVGHAGGTTIDGSAVTVGSGGAAGTLAGNVQFVNGGALAFNRTGTVTYAGNAAGAGSLAQVGPGTLVLTGTNTYTGGTTVSAGVLQIGGGGGTGSITGDVTNNAAVVVNRSGSLALAGNITGSGSVTQAGPGTLTLSGNNGYAGGTTVSGGTLVLGSATAIPSGGAVTVSGGTLSTGTLSGTLTFGTLTATASGSAITLGVQAPSLVFAGFDGAGLATGGLTVNGWSGPTYGAGTAGRLFFVDGSGLTQSVLDKINFSGYTPGAFLLTPAQSGTAYFELVAAPEPGAVLAVAAAGLAGLRLVRRRRAAVA
jgi:autotransporter-associated beta strand protein